MQCLSYTRRMSSRASGRATLYHFKNVLPFLHILLTRVFRWNVSTGKRTTFTQCIEHLEKQYKIRNSSHRKLATVFFNSSSGTTLSEAVKVQRIWIFGICDDLRHFLQYSYNVAISSHNSQLTLHTGSIASGSGAVRTDGRTVLGATAKLLYSPTFKQNLYRPHTLYIHWYYHFLYLHYFHLTTCFGAFHVRHHQVYTIQRNIVTQNKNFNV